MMHGNQKPLIGAVSFSIILFIAATSLGSVSTVAHAQEVDGAKGYDEIIVTVRRREETLKDVPATVFVFTEEDIERSNITRAADIAMLTPGVSMVDAAEVGDTQVNIRGMNGARDAENSYALVIDGIIMTNPAALNREYSNLQQIAVLKGPQGAIYGRNGSAGAFIITTQVPEDEMTGKIIASAGEDTTYRLVADVAGPISNSVRGSLMGEYFTTDGYYKNDYLNRDDIVDNRENWAITGRLIFDVGDNTEIDTKLRYGEVDASSITFNSVFHIPFFAEQGFGDAFYEDVNEHPFNFYNNVIHTNDQEALEFSAKIETEFDAVTLTAWGLYSDIDNQLGADGTSAAFDFFNADVGCQDTYFGDPALANTFGQYVNAPQFIGPAPGFPDSVLGAYTPTACDGTQFQRRNQEDISFEARLASNGDGPLQWMGGVYFLTIDREVAVSTGIDRLNAPSYRGGTVIQAPYTTDPTNPTEQLVWDQFDTDVYSVFGQIGYDFTDAFTMDFALRYDKEEREVNNLVPTVADGAISQYINPCPAGDGLTPGVDTPFNPGLCPSLGNVGGIPSDSRDFSEWQPKLSFSWDALESTTFFGSWGVGFRSGGFNNSGSAATVDTFINDLLFDAAGNNGLCDPDVPGCIETGRSQVGIEDGYDKETSSAFELGFKSTFADNAIRLEGAAYYTEVDDMQFFEFIVGGFGLLRVVENIDEVEIRGVELGLTWDAADWVDLFIGGNWNDTEIMKNTVRPDTVGNDAPYTPDYTANLGAYFSWPMDNNLSFFTNVDIATVGKTWFHVVQDQTRPIGFELNPLVNGPFAPGDYSIARRDDYTLTNLRLGIEAPKWTAALWITNLTDQEFLEENIPAPEFGGSFAHPGTLRRIGADFTWRF
jgi:iron complex outermembrane receptor protein